MRSQLQTSVPDKTTHVPAIVPVLLLAAFFQFRTNNTTMSTVSGRGRFNSARWPSMYWRICQRSVFACRASLTSCVWYVLLNLPVLYFGVAWIVWRSLTIPASALNQDNFYQVCSSRTRLHAISKIRLSRELDLSCYLVRGYAKKTWAIWICYNSYAT